MDLWLCIIYSNVKIYLYHTHSMTPILYVMSKSNITIYIKFLPSTNLYKTRKMIQLKSLKCNIIIEGACVNVS